MHSGETLESLKVREDWPKPVEISYSLNCRASEMVRPQYSVAAPWLALLISAAVVLGNIPALPEPDGSPPTRNSVLLPD